MDSPSYALSRYLIDILKQLTINSKYNIRDAVEFSSKINNTYIADDEVLISFDVISLFPSIPINLAIGTIEEKWDLLTTHTNIPKNLFIDILRFCIKDSRYLKYDDKIYEQRKGMPMGSPASPVIADIIMEQLLDISIDKMDEKPRMMMKYVDDIFAIVKKDKVSDTLNKLNSYNRQIQFTMEEEKDEELSYLDAIVIRKGNHLKVNWYQKPTASGRLINFHSKHPRRIIINTASNFIRRVLQISDTVFHKNNKAKIMDILKMNDFPIKTIKDLIKRAKSKRQEEREPKRYKSITYISGLSERWKNSDIYNAEEFELAFRSDNTVNRLFSKTKSKLKKEEKSNVVYQIPCNGDGPNICQKVYVGTTKTKLKTRLSSHKADQRATEKPIDQKTALAAHCALTNHKPKFEEVKILQEERNYSRRYTLEMLHIINVRPELRLNYRQDTENCAHIYRQLIKKHRRWTN